MRYNIIMKQDIIDTVKNIAQGFIILTCIWALARGMYVVLEDNWFAGLFVIACIICIATWKESLE